jgi:hypothetical protein
MCFAQPQAPNIVYQGPSDAEIEANRASLDQYRSQMGQQQADFQKQLQAQIDKANQDTENLQKQYEADAAAAAAAAQQTGSYAVTASQTAPVNAQTTAATTKKEKPKSTLKISTGGVAASAGSGLNIGV